MKYQPDIHPGDVFISESQPPLEVLRVETTSNRFNRWSVIVTTRLADKPEGPSMTDTLDELIDASYEHVAMNRSNETPSSPDLIEVGRLFDDFNQAMNKALGRDKQ